MDNKLSRSIGRMLRSKYFYGATSLGLTALTLLDPGGMRPRESLMEMLYPKKDHQVLVADFSL